MAEYLDTDSLYVSGFENVCYEQCLGDISRRLRASQARIGHETSTE